MNLPFKDKTMLKCQECFNKIDPERAIQFNQYQLAKLTEIKDPNVWREFLMEPRVMDWMQQEVESIRQVQLRRVIHNAAENDRSVGTAQMIGALTKAGDTTQTKEGPTFIYSYVPLNDREQEGLDARQEERS